MFRRDSSIAARVAAKTLS